MYYVYILRSGLDGSYYIGFTQGIDARLERHNQGRTKYTRGKRPWRLIYSEEHPNRSSAMKRKQEIKKHKSKRYVEHLVNTSRQ